MKTTVKTNQIAWGKTNAAVESLSTNGKRLSETKWATNRRVFMAGKKGQSEPPGNANAFQHGPAAVQRRRAEGGLTEEEHNIRANILAGLIADKGGERQIGTAKRILAEIISSPFRRFVG